MAMIPGISTACFYPQHTEEALQELSVLKIQAAEVFINCLDELSPHFIKKLKYIADFYGVNIISLHPYTSMIEYMLFFSDYDRRFHEGREFYKKYYEAANLLGAKIVVFHGAFHNYPWSLEEYYERFGTIVDDAKRYGVELCHENVSRCIGCYPDFFESLSKAVPDAGFVLDIKQAYRAESDIFTFVQSMGDKLRHIHISDHDEVNICLPPGQGIFNIVVFLNAIRESGFDGGVIVELYRENFKDIVELYSGYQHLSDIISTYK